MEILSLKHNIMNGDLDNFYIFTGDEITMQQIYVNQISKVSDKSVKYIDDISTLYSTSNSLFQKPYCYVCIDDMAFMDSEKAWNNIKSVLSDNILIVWYNKIDKRSKFYKHFKEDITVFEPMSAEILKKHIKEQIDLSDRNCDTLVKMCENNYDRILLEIDKIKNWYNLNIKNQSASVLYDEAFKQLLSDGTICASQQNIVFEFVDSVIIGDITNSFRLLDDCIEQADSNLGVLTLLYNNFKMLLQVQSCKADNVSENTGLEEWEVKRTKAKIGAYSIREIIDAMQLIREMEIGVKQGIVTEEYVLPYTMVKILN